jgi:hypothetical protein
MICGFILFTAVQLGPAGIGVMSSVYPCSTHDAASLAASA